MRCKLCELEAYDDTFCNNCAKELETKIGIKCDYCGTYGFIEPTEQNIKRFEFFIPNLEENLKLCDVCIVPMNGCPECYGKRESMKSGAPIH